MAIPKNKKKINIADKVDKAFNTINALNSINTHTSEKSDNKVKRKKPGRPSTIPNRTAKMHFYLSKETFDRFNLAFLEEQIKQTKKGSKIDKSYIVELALREWMDKNKY